jgi:DNA (cytosine-5)-methyltransferase 1
MRFFDFCSGIGGGRIALEAAGHTCVGYCEKDKTADVIFSYLTGDCRGFGDIMLIDPERLPEFDIMLAGFPYKNFSASGKRDGFNDNKAHVITALIGILSVKRPTYFIFENDKGFLSYNGGRAFRTVCGALENAGYDVYTNILNSSDYGIPHNRERVYLVGAPKGAWKEGFLWPEKTECAPLSQFLCDDTSPVLPVSDPTFFAGLANDFNRGRIYIDRLLSEDYTVIDRRWNDYRVHTDKVPALSSSRAGIVYTLGSELKKLTAYEALLLQGFPEATAKKARDAGILRGSLMKYAANSVSVNVIYRIALCLEKQAAEIPSDFSENGTKKGFTSENLRTKKRFLSAFTSFPENENAVKWISLTGYDVAGIDTVYAEPIQKDMPLRIYIKEKGKRSANIIKIGFFPLSAKLRTAKIAKIPLEKLKEKWNIPEEVYSLLAFYVNGMRFREMTVYERETVRAWFFENRFLIVSDVVCGIEDSARDFVFFPLKHGEGTAWYYSDVGAIVGRNTGGQAEFKGDSVKVCGITVSRAPGGCLKFSITVEIGD